MISPHRVCQGKIYDWVQGLAFTKRRRRMTTDPFLRMIVEDVFMIRGRGTVVTGKIETGILKVGDDVVIKGANGQKTTTVTGIESFRKALNQANPGDTVGLLLKDLSKQDIQHGDEILAPQNDFTWNP